MVFLGKIHYLKVKTVNFRRRIKALSDKSWN